MEFIASNYFDTSTQASVDANTALVSELINWDTSFQWQSDGFDDDTTTTSITISFDNTTAVSRLLLLGHNLKSFDIYYNGATANTFDLTGGGASHTSTSQWTTNSLGSHYLRMAEVNVTSITLDLKSTQTANQEKAIGFLGISKLELDFTVNGRVPSAKNYKPRINPKQIEHQMSDGGTRLHYISTKRSAEIKYKHVGATFKDELKTIYDARKSYIFCSFPTATAWDEFCFDSVWTGPFEFFTYSDNNAGAGFSGKIKLKETTRK